MKLINLVCWSRSSGSAFFYLSKAFLACLTKFLSMLMPSGLVGKEVGSEDYPTRNGFTCLSAILIGSNDYLYLFNYKAQNLSSE